MVKEDRLLDVSAVAVRLEVSLSTVYRLIEAKELPVERRGVSKGYRVPASGVDEFKLRRREDRQ